MKKRLFTVVHEHCHGLSVYLVRCPRKPTVKQVIKACDITFEPDREESLTIDEHPDAKIHHIDIP